MNRKDRRAALKGASGDGGFEAALGLAMACCNGGDWAGAERGFRAALRLRPDIAECHANLGAVLQAQGKLVEAVAAFTKAARLKPDSPETQFNLGAGLLALNRFAEAVEPLRRAVGLRPGYAEAECNLGQALFGLKRWDEAVAAHDRAIAARPAFAIAHNNRGAALAKLGRPEEALAAHRRAIELESLYAEAWVNVGDCLLSLGHPDQAVTAFERALDVAPTLIEAINGLGIAWRDLGQVERAEAAYRRAIAQDPKFGKGWANLCDVLALDGRFAEAVEAGRRAVVLIPDGAAAHSCLGVALEGNGQGEAALAAYENAVKCDPDHARAQVNRALTLLRRGRFAEGWAAQEWRWKLPEFTPLGAAPPWRGEDPSGRTILLTTEQGYGDTVHFVRFAATLAARGARVVLRVAPPLLRLMQGVAGLAEVVSDAVPPPSADFEVSLLSLPHWLGVTEIPPQAPYLSAQPSRSWPSPCIGLVWAGAAHSAIYAPVDRRRSLRPEQLAPLMALPAITWVSLQKDLPIPAGIEDGLAEAKDFADTAAVIAGLDLVISVDTAVAHLAAAMGKPVWLLSRFDACWRWMTDREDSPWYPTLRLFRQERAGEWGPVLERVAEELCRRTGACVGGGGV